MFVVWDVDDDEMFMEINKYLSNKLLAKSDIRRRKFRTRSAPKVDKKKEIVVPKTF